SSRALVRAPASFTRGTGATGRGITVAIVDSGLDGTHPDFEGRVAANLLWDGNGWGQGGVDSDGHGTHVAGIVAGDGSRSGRALHGFAPDARVAVLGFGDRFTTTVATRAFDWILTHRDEHGIRVVQNSWGRAETGRAFDPGDPLVRAAGRLVDVGIVVVFSASNHGPAASTVALEAQDPQVLTVGAVDDAALPAEFSSRGPVRLADGSTADWTKPDVVADGVAVRAPRAAGSAPAEGATGLASLPPIAQDTVFYREMQGTSQAAPAVAGIVALMLETDPALTPRDVKRILLESAIDLDAPGPDDATGFGLVDVPDALALARGGVATHGSVLVAGGEETFTSTGRVAGSGTAALQLEPAPELRQEDLVRATFPVKPGATKVAFELSWTGETRMQVFLHDGASYEGPWGKETREAGRRVVRGAVDDPEPGVWTLMGRPASPADVDYASTVRVAVKECPECVSVVDPAYLDAGPSVSAKDSLMYEWQDALAQSRAYMEKAVEAPGRERNYILVAAGVLGVAILVRAVRR
ncbi:MAG TPA: S8 family serine peptidase, partial [Candidatus Thermoplasmatota archaeon]|nr:S8 family serine peptidase [Candidatus Thermoplasmatota archaeon]